jgi:hypothetical protein
VIVHGHAAIIPHGAPTFDELDEIQTGTGQQSPRDWEGDASYLKIEAATMYTYASNASAHPTQA